MAAVEITISGILYDKQAKTSQQVALIGEGSLTGLGVGGGPIIPPQKPPQPPDLGIWPNPPEGIAPHPEHPIVIPPPGEKPPIDPSTPPVSWKPVWTQSEGWVVVGVINPDIPHPVPSGAQPT